MYRATRNLALTSLRSRRLSLAKDRLLRWKFQPSTSTTIFGAVNANPAHPYAHAFELSLGALAAILLSVAALTRLIPAPVRS